MAGEDFDLIREKKENLEKELHELSATIYHQTAGAGADPTQGQRDRRERRKKAPRLMPNTR